MKLISKKKAITTSGTIEYALSVKQSPAIILINGAGGPLEGWFKIFTMLAERSSVLAYNRLGEGRSDKPTSPQHGEAIVRALRQLLHELNILPPYVIVGHSLGGFYANLFARQHPDEVAGVVLLEASHPLDIAINDTQSTFIKCMNKVLGLFDSLSPHNKWMEVNYVEQTAQQIEQAGPFPELPLFVLSGNKKPPMMPDHALDIRKRNQLKLVQLNASGTHIIAERSGHFPQMSEPELVVQTIQACVEQTMIS